MGNAKLTGNFRCASASLMKHQHEVSVHDTPATKLYTFQFRLLSPLIRALQFPLLGRCWLLQTVHESFHRERSLIVTYDDVSAIPCWYHLTILSSGKGDDVRKGRGEDDTEPSLFDIGAYYIIKVYLQFLCAEPAFKQIFTLSSFISRGQVMKYIINGIVEYDAVNGTLFSPESSLEMITLSRVASELLFILIKHNHHPISREKLLHDLWESKGLSASSNNLNNYMSMLRKALMQCGCPELITTIPKYGFVFEAEIEEANAQTTPKTENLSEDGNNRKEPDRHHPKERGACVKMGRRSWGTAIKRLMAVGSILALVAVTVLLYNYYRLSTIRSELFRLGQCNVYTGDDQTRSQNPDELIEAIKNILVAENIKCQVKANVYYFSDKMRDASGHAIMEDLLSYCPYGSKAFCVNYYSTTHIMHDEDKK